MISGRPVRVCVEQLLIICMKIHAQDYISFSLSRVALRKREVGQLNAFSARQRERERERESEREKILFRQALNTHRRERRKVGENPDEDKTVFD